MTIKISGQPGHYPSQIPAHPVCLTVTGYKLTCDQTHGSRLSAKYQMESIIVGGNPCSQACSQDFREGVFSPARCSQQLLGLTTAGAI